MSFVRYLCRSQVVSCGDYLNVIHMFLHLIDKHVEQSAVRESLKHDRTYSVIFVTLSKGCGNHIMIAASIVVF